MYSGAGQCKKAASVIHNHYWLTCQGCFDQHQLQPPMDSQKQGSYLTYMQYHKLVYNSSKSCSCCMSDVETSRLKRQEVARQL